MYISIGAYIHKAGIGTCIIKKACVIGIAFFDPPKKVKSIIFFRKLKFCFEIQG